MEAKPDVNISDTSKSDLGPSAQVQVKQEPNAMPKTNFEPASNVIVDLTGDSDGDTEPTSAPTQPEPEIQMDTRVEIENSEVVDTTRSTLTPGISDLSIQHQTNLTAPSAADPENKDNDASELNAADEHQEASREQEEEEGMLDGVTKKVTRSMSCLLYTSPSPRDS